MENQQVDPIKLIKLIEPPENPSILVWQSTIPHDFLQKTQGNPSIPARLAIG